MQWLTKPLEFERERFKFCWWPRAGTDGRTYWLQRVWIIQKYHMSYAGGCWCTVYCSEIVP